MSIVCHLPTKILLVITPGQKTEQKAMHVKNIFLLVLLSTLSISVSAQNADSLLLENFKQSVIKRFDYPNELVNRCSGTSVILKINVNAKGEVVDMKLSDSADPFFVIEWLSKEKEMNVISLKRYISPLWVLSPTSRHVLRLCYFKTVLKVVGDNTNKGTN
ncbi:MAG: hypothetical protein WC615_10410 [Mucilaginibacter sp.]|jgi:hypothetical protein|uniref:hypothetical protein n=1 Tax=Mucilaginibacter sp. TaxID=1882438 RepID=UPI0035616ED3